MNIARARTLFFSLLTLSGGLFLVTRQDLSFPQVMSGVQVSSARHDTSPLLRTIKPPTDIGRNTLDEGGDEDGDAAHKSAGRAAGILPGTAVPDPIVQELPGSI